MLNERTAKVLDIIQDFCVEPDAFKVLDAEDILAKLPQEMPMTKTELSNAIKELKERELVKVKYFTLDEYVLSASPRAKIEQEKRQEETKVEAAIASGHMSQVTGKEYGKKKKATPSKGSFLGAFLGSLLGGGVIMVIYILLQMFVL